MPKRPNPSSSSNNAEEKADAKKAKTAEVVGFVDKVISYVRPAATTLVATNSNKEISSASSSTAKVDYSATANGGSSSGGGNKLLKSLRSKACEEEPPASNNNGSSSSPKKPTSSSKKTKESSSEPVVPFPHLPHDNNSVLEKYSNNKNNKPLLLFTSILLVILNISTFTYITSIQSIHNIHRMKHDMIVNKLQNEVLSSQNELELLRSRMNLLEDEAASVEAINSVGYDDGKNRSSEEERKRYLDQIQLLENERKVALEEFNKNLSEF